MKKVLIIEDNEDNMYLVSQLLKNVGYDTVWADTGAKGIKLALEEEFDCILLDIQLPDIDGTDVLRQIRASESGRKTPIIAVTSYAMTGDRDRLLGAGCNGYIEKPIDPMKFTIKVEKVLKDMENENNDSGK